MSDKKHILVTGCAGFIGFHLCKRLLEDGFHVTGIDYTSDLNSTKSARLFHLIDSNFEFVNCDVRYMTHLFERKTVVHLAALAGVRPSMENPINYIDNNVMGFSNMIELCRKKEIPHFIFASSSSVYGSSYFFSENVKTDKPESVYAATKKCNEVLAYSYSNLYSIPCTGLRFFTVYGPWGRPDMAYYKFAKNIMRDNPIQVFNNGDVQRDFTYVADVVESIYRVIVQGPKTNYDIYNIGHESPTGIMRFIELLEKYMGKKAIIEYADAQLGDAVCTASNMGKFEKDYGYRCDTRIEDGLKKFVDWFNAEGYKYVD